MAFTSAERSALWRKRQRDDPTKHESYKQREKERYKKRKASGQIKAIHELTEREQRKQRRHWRTNQKSKREREELIKKAIRETNTPPTSPEQFLPPQQNRLHELNRSNGRRKKNLNRSKAYRDIYKLRIELDNERRLKNKYKRRYFRLTECKKDDIEHQVADIMKQKEKTKSALTLYCLLIRNLKQRYANTKTPEKRMLKSLIFREAVLKKYKIGAYAANETGISETRTRQKEKPYRRIQCTLKKNIVAFFERDDNSRVKAGKRSTRTRQKIKKQVRLLNDSVKNLHQKYLFESHSKISYSLFAKMKPFWVIQATEKDRQTCLCKVHENPTLKANKLYSEKVLKNKDLRGLIKDIVCDLKSKACMYRTRNRCKDLHIKTAIGSDEINAGKIVSWKIWKSRRIEREKCKNGETVVSKHNITVKENETGTITTLVDDLQSDIERLARHEFNISHQFITLKKLKETCRENELILHVDFSENYLCKYQEEIQSVHFGASKNQISIHTGVAYMRNITIPFATMSDNISHGPPAIWAHLQPPIQYIKQKHPMLSKLHVISDGPTTQYRCRTNFYVFSTKTIELGFSEGGSWNFMEAGHGKGAPDGIGAVVKRAADTLVNTYSRDITRSADLVEGLRMLKSSVLAFEVKEEEVSQQERNIPSNIVPVPDTMKIHQVVLKQMGVVASRPLSCFCTEDCTCFEPVTTTFCVQQCDSAALSKNQNEPQTELNVCNQDENLQFPSTFDEALIDKYCVVEYDGCPYPGKILDVDDSSLEVSAMHRIGNNRFFWPMIPDVIWYDQEKVVTLLNSEPELVTSRHREIDKNVWSAIVKKMNL